MRGCIVKPTARNRRKSWAVRIDLGRDPVTRKRRQKWYSHSTRKEAEAHLAAILSEVQGGTYVPPTKLPAGDFFEQWLADYATGAVGPVTLRDYQTIVRKWLTPHLGKLPLAMLSAQAIQGYLSKRLEDLSAASVHKHYRLLHAILGHAVRWGLLARNPAAMVDPPRPADFEPRVWDAEQVRVFLAEAKRASVHYPLYLTALLTGLRLGELLGLRWQDVDLPTGTLTVRQTFYRLGRERLFKAPKSKTSRRTVALPEAVVEALREVQAHQREARVFFGADYQDHGLVFCQPNGKPLHAHNISQRDFQRIARLEALRKTLTEQGVAENALPKPLPRIRFHDLRHCHASYLALAGVPVKVAQERLGHSTPMLTLKVYTHTLAGQDRAAAVAVADQLLGRLVRTGAQTEGVESPNDRGTP